MGVDEVKDVAWQRWQKDLFSRKQLISDAMQIRLRQEPEEGSWGWKHGYHVFFKPALQTGEMKSM